MKKKLLSLLLAAALVCGLAPAALAAEAGTANFGKVNNYNAQTFTDVTDGTWYTENVKTAYELDLMKGSSATAFSPDAPITIGSAVAMAARLHSIYNTGTADFVQGTPWYAVYVDYAVENGIIAQGQFNNYNANATRREFAAILAKALPADALKAFNTVEDGAIPDVAAGSANYNDIYVLYRAGILTGSDKKGSFQPENTIGRSSVAAIVSRMAVPSLRQGVTLKLISVTGVTLSKTTLSLEAGKTAALTATITPEDASSKLLTWTSSNTGVATVKDGTVTAVKAGSATITATAANGVKATCAVTVTPAPVAATGVTLNKTTLGLGVNATETLIATVQPSNATDKNVTWTSSNTSVATVSASGTVTGKAVGSATITAATANGKTASCTVTVSKMGTMSNPYKADGSVVVPYQEWSHYPVKNVRIQCTGELRGSAANALAQEENRYNDVPNSNQEWRFYEFQLTYVSCSGAEESLEAQKVIYDDTFFTTSGSSVNVADKATLSHVNKGYGVFDVDLYPGGSSRVVIGILINKNAGDLLLKVPSNAGKSATWLLCAPGTTGGLTTGSSSSSGSSSSGGSGSGSSSNLNGRYADFPSVPDFGAVMGISPKTSAYKASEDEGAYFYTLTSISSAGHDDDFADLYSSRLESAGFTYLSSFTNSDGGTTLIFSNGTYAVMYGIAIISGTPGIMVAVTPA